MVREVFEEFHDNFCNRRWPWRRPILHVQAERVCLTGSTPLFTGSHDTEKMDYFDCQFREIWVCVIQFFGVYLNCDQESPDCPASLNA